jgi:adenylate kinase family enzyme
MHALVFGNSVAGKTFYAQRLVAAHRPARLDLDKIDWKPGRVAALRSAGAIDGDLHRFIASHPA